MGSNSIKLNTNQLLTRDNYTECTFLAENENISLERNAKYAFRKQSPTRWIVKCILNWRYLLMYVVSVWAVELSRR